MSQPWRDAFKLAQLGHFLSDFDVICFRMLVFLDESNGDNN